MFPTPMQRADINAALIRQSCGQWKKPPKLADLLLRFGPRRVKSAEEMKLAAQQWAASSRQ